MTLSLTTYSNSTIDAEFREAKYSDEMELVRVFYNGRRIRLTPYRETLIYNAFAERFDLAEEMANYKYERKYA